MLHNTLQINSTQMVPGARGSAVALFVSAFFLGQSTGVALAAWAVDAVGPLWLFGAAADGASSDRIGICPGAPSTSRQLGPALNFRTALDRFARMRAQPLPGQFARL